MWTRRRTCHISSYVYPSDKASASHIGILISLFPLLWRYSSCRQPDTSRTTEATSISSNVISNTSGECESCTSRAHPLTAATTATCHGHDRASKSHANCRHNICHSSSNRKANHRHDCSRKCSPADPSGVFHCHVILHSGAKLRHEPLSTDSAASRRGDAYNKCVISSICW